MAYPPTAPPATRSDATPLQTSHAGDHNLLAQAIADIVAELGPNPSGALTTLTERLEGMAPASELALKANLAGATFTGDVKVPRIGVGNGVGSDRRQPFQGNVVLDGTALANHPTPKSNKVGQVNAVRFSGSFVGEGALGMPDPGFGFGANDFVTTGTAAGDGAGMTAYYGRLSEFHVYAPGADVATVKGLAGEANIGPGATDAHVGTLISVEALGPRVRAGNADLAVALRVTAPTTEGAGTIDAAYGIYADGAAYFATGLVTANAGLLAAGNAGLRSIATTPNAQAAPVGAYLGVTGGDPGLELANGTSNYRLDNAGGVFRILRAGNVQLLGVDGSANINIRDTLFAPAVAPTSGGHLFSEGGALKWRGSAGTVTTLAPA